MTAPAEELDCSREAVARWVDRAAGPLLARLSEAALERDHGGTPIARDDLREAARCGLLAASLRTSLGGRGMGHQAWGRVLEHVGATCDDGSFALLLSLFPAVANLIHASGRGDLTERYARPCGTGHTLVSFAFTEDSDPFSFSTTLKLDGDDAVIDGCKAMVTGGAVADAYMTYVVNEASRDLAVVIIDRDTPGVEVRPLDTMGLRSAGLASIRFDGVRVPKSQIMVEHDGLGHVQLFLNPRRAILCCAPVGRMGRILTDCAQHLSRTIRYGRPLTEMQAVQARIGKMQLALTVSRTLLDRALEDLDQGSSNPMFDTTVSTAKHQITENALALALDALQLMGGRGYARSTPIERYLRDFCGLIPGAGTQDILQTNLGLIAIAGARMGR